MRSMGKRVLFTLGIALFVIAALVAMPRVARAANATWNTDTPPELNASHNGGTVTMSVYAGGTLIIPESVRTLTIVGPGLKYPVSSANIDVRGDVATTLTISDLTMTTPARCIHAITAPFVVALTLNLTDVTLYGESSSTASGGEAIYAGYAALSIYAKNSVTIVGGNYTGTDNAQGAGFGINAKTVTISGSLTAKGGNNNNNNGPTGGGSGIALNGGTSLTVNYGAVTAKGGNGSKGGTGVHAPSYGSHVTIAKGASLSATGGDATVGNNGGPGIYFRNDSYVNLLGKLTATSGAPKGYSIQVLNYGTSGVAFGDEAATLMVQGVGEPDKTHIPLLIDSSIVGMEFYNDSSSSKERLKPQAYVTSTNTPTTVALRRDRMTPYVTGTVPADGATNVPVTTAELSITFSEEMNATPGTMKLSPAATLTNLKWSADKMTATYTLSGLTYGKTYTYDISEFKDSADNVMDLPLFPIKFTTESTEPPTLVGPTALTLTRGYAATSTGAYDIKSKPAPTVTISGNDAITWNDATKKLNIAAGLAVGSYPVQLTVSNGFDPNATLTFTLTVTVAPTLAGPKALTLTQGYAATSTDAYTITGDPTPTVTKTSGNAAITWNAATKKLDIAAGLVAGSYTVNLTANNGPDSEASLSFTLTVNAVPTLTGPAALTLTQGYAAISTDAYTITGYPAPTVIKTSGNAAITWNDAAKKLDIAAGLPAGRYPVDLKASNGVGSDATLTFTLTVNAAPSYTYTLTVTPPVFGDVTLGYSRPSAKPITITSSGNSTATIAKVESDSADFDISGSGDTVTAGGSIGSWTVQPVDGLAVGVHEATITVTYNGGATATAQVSLRVNEPVPTTWSIPKTFKATKGFSYQLANASPDGRELPTLKFTRSNKNASIDEKGVLIAKTAGTVTIKATDASGASMKCKVTVVANSYTRSKPLMLAGGGVFSSTKKIYYKNKKLYLEVFVLNRSGKSIKCGGELRLELWRGDELLYTKPMPNWKPSTTLKHKKYAIYKLSIKESALAGVSKKAFDLGRGEIQAVIAGTDVYGNTYTPLTPKTPGATKAKGVAWALTEDLDGEGELPMEYPIP